MQSTLLHGGGGSGGSVVSGGSMSTLSTEENDTVMSSEESCSYPDESKLELGLGLSLGGGGGGKARTKPPVAAASGGSWDKYARILTAKDFPTGVSSKASLSSSSSSSVTKANNTNGSCGTKRTAEPPSSPPGRSAVSQVVGWPPIRTYRMNSLTSHGKSPVTEDFFLTAEKCKSKNIVADRTNHNGNMNNNSAKEKGLVKTSLFIKVNMDGIPIGRKIDLNAHSSYDNLARALDDMFRPSAAVGTRLEEQAVVGGTRQPLRLLDGSSDFVLTYEDKEGDWMLVGDVPWEMFLNSVRRLRIMRTAEANGLAPGSHGRNTKQ